MEEQLAKYFAGEASAEEKNVINTWRSENEENAIAFLEFKETWLLTSFEGTTISEQKSEEELEVKVIGWPSYIKYAAAVVLLAMIGTIWFFNQGGEDSLAPSVFAGSSQILEDGSTLSLKAGAQITQLEFTESERKVYVKGKVFFEVVRDENRPFYVITEDATVKVLGTSFLVNGETDYTEVCVESGLVS
ncbi:MAG: FecR domain-containing protein, partial [Cyclobacteriaceae bacterium]